MKRRSLIKSALTAIPAMALSQAFGVNILNRFEHTEHIATGPFKPEWSSLENYEVPVWFRDAKFGIWAHWGPQCQPEHGDWYARSMYQEGTDDYKFHCEKYGHPSKFGFKDVINEWKAENWNPEELLLLYKNAGAKYFFALANHHDNFDLYKSNYQSWNSTRIGPKKDLIAGWANAAKKQGLPFGVSVHASHAWRWYESAQRSDTTGQYAGIPYDGKPTLTVGKNKWWEGYDPQELYAQNHALSENSLDNNAIFKQWSWGNGTSVPSAAYCEKFYNRTIELINRYDPELVYFDDTVLPLWPVSDAGLRIAAHLYNKSLKKYGHVRAVINGKILNEQQRKCMVWDIERGQSNQIEPLPWQTDTCIGDWHYDRRIFDQKRYKSAKTVIHTLADVVSKNGNLLLNIPVRGNGTIDSEELFVVAGITAWIKMNGECIFGTRPWKICGEGPAMESVAPLSAQGFNEGKGRPFTGSDYRFTTKGEIVYAISLGLPPGGHAVIKSLGLKSRYYPGRIGGVSLIGTKQLLQFDRNGDALVIKLPDNLTEQVAFSFKILPA